MLIQAIRPALLLCGVLYVLGFDWCLFANSTLEPCEDILRSPCRDDKTIGLGIILQLICFFFIAHILLRTAEYSRRVRTYIRSPKSRVAAWVLPFFLLPVSVSMIMLGLHNHGHLEKIENSRLRAEVVRKCYSLGFECGARTRQRD